MQQFIESALGSGITRPAQGAVRARAKSAAWNMPGFGPLTPVETEYGPYPAQALRVRDRVRLRSGRFRPIVRVDRLLLDEAFLERNEDAQPVLVLAGRLGYGVPKEPVLLSPGQKVSAAPGSSAPFRTARELLSAGIALRRPEKFMTYVIFSFDEPEEICSNGLWLCVEPPAMRRDDIDA